MSRKIMVAIVAVVFTLGLCSVALAGDPDRVSSQFSFDSDTQTTAGNSMASQHASKPSMQEQKAEPCALVLADATVNATNRPSPTSPCFKQYEDRYGS